MSVSEPNAAASQEQIVLPPGVVVGAGRETSQVPALGGALTQGVIYPIQLANGTSSSVFVPNTAFSSIAQVQAIFDAKIAQLGIIPIG